MKALDCEACDDDHEGRFDIDDLFSVELCGRCARDLRDALHHDPTLLVAHVGLKMAQTLEAITIQNARQAAQANQLAESLSSVNAAISDATTKFYDAVMAWCKKHKEIEEARS